MSTTDDHKMLTSDTMLTSTNDMENIATPILLHLTGLSREPHYRYTSATMRGYKEVLSMMPKLTDVAAYDLLRQCAQVYFEHTDADTPLGKDIRYRLDKALAYNPYQPIPGADTHPFRGANNHPFARALQQTLNMIKHKIRVHGWKTRHSANPAMNDLTTKTNSAMNDLTIKTQGLHLELNVDQLTTRAHGLQIGSTSSQPEQPHNEDAYRREFFAKLEDRKKAAIHKREESEAIRKMEDPRCFSIAEYMKAGIHKPEEGEAIRKMMESISWVVSELELDLEAKMKRDLAVPLLPDEPKTPEARTRKRARDDEDVPENVPKRARRARIIRRVGFRRLEPSMSQRPARSAQEREAQPASTSPGSDSTHGQARLPVTAGIEIVNALDDEKR